MIKLSHKELRAFSNFVFYWSLRQNSGDIGNHKNETNYGYHKWPHISIMCLKWPYIVSTTRIWWSKSLLNCFVLGGFVSGLYKAETNVQRLCPCLFASFICGFWGRRIWLSLPMAKITIEGLSHIIVRVLSDAFSHLYKRECRSVRPSVEHELNLWQIEFRG